MSSIILPPTSSGISYLLDAGFSYCFCLSYNFLKHSSCHFQRCMVCIHHDYFFLGIWLDLGAIRPIHCLSGNVYKLKLSSDESNGRWLIWRGERFKTFNWDSGRVSTKFKTPESIRRFDGKSLVEKYLLSKRCTQFNGHRMIRFCISMFFTERLFRAVAWCSKSFIGTFCHNICYVIY